MDLQYNPLNYKKEVNFYSQQLRNYYNPNLEFKSSIYMYKSHHNQMPLNFIGIKKFHNPMDDSRMFHPAPMDGVWRAEQHIPIMRTMPVFPKTS